MKTPRRRVDEGQPLERFGRYGRERELEQAASTVRGRSSWWRVFRVPALTRVRDAVLPRTAYPRTPGRLPPLGSLSAFPSCQGAILRRRRRSRPNPGSVQWVFLHTGPP